MFLFIMNALDDNIMSLPDTPSTQVLPQPLMIVFWTWQPDQQPGYCLTLTKVTNKIQSLTGNEKLEEAIQSYEQALAEMQSSNDVSSRMQVRAMLLRAYEMQAILSPDVSLQKLQLYFFK